MTCEDNTCCWFNSCLYREQTQLEIEELFDDNDTEVIFMNESMDNSINDNIFPKTPILFLCNSYRFGDKRLAWKFSTDQNISIVLIFQYNENGGRTLISSDIYKGDNKYKIKEIKMHDELKVDNITYENIVKCVFD